jgi:quinolinate synthase
MAETAKIQNPEKKVIVPDINAGCSLADSCTADLFKSFIDKHPGHVVITYVNCSADIKALSDLVCTSSNALGIVNSVPVDTPIIFAPDKNLGRYINKLTGRNMVLWEGSCIVHEAFSIDKILELHLKYPDAEIIAHPESEEPILKVASYVGSTSGMIKYVKASPVREFIVGTEVGILHEMKQSLPDKIFIPAPSWQDNTCACSQCEYMKVNTLEKLYNCLKDESPEIKIPEEIRIRAQKPIQKMLEMSC